MRLLKRIRDERGFALPLALFTMVIMSMTTVAVIEFSSSSGRTAHLSQARVSAEALAEAGINDALSILNQAYDPKTGTLLPSTTVAMDGGSVTYSGTYNATTYVWTITSTGTVPNPNGGAATSRTLGRTAQIYGIGAGDTTSGWSRYYQDSTTTCLTIDTVTIPSPVASRGSLCLKNGGNITGATTTVEVGTTVTVTASDTSSGARSPSAATGWTSSSNVYASDNVKATNTVNGSTTGAYLDVSGFGFAIPSTAIIRGITVSVERNAGTSSTFKDYGVYLLKGGASAGTDHTSSSYWGTSESTPAYGSSSDLWGTTWTPAEINASNFGVHFRAHNYGFSSATGYVDRIQITVEYTGDTTTAVGSSGSNILRADIGGTCTYNAATAHTPCTSADRVYAGTISSSPAALVKPSIDMAWWWANAKPGPKHYCTEAGNSFPGGFDTDAGSTSAPNNSVTGLAEMTPTGSDYTCQVKENGVLVGEISWNHTTHVMKILGTVYVDGDFRFDDDGQLVNYQGRGIIYATDDVEFDERVCAGGTGTTDCTTSMSTWDSSQNMITILAGDDLELDHNGSASVPDAFQGTVYAVDTCTIHEFFYLSGPAVCGTMVIDQGNESTFPAFYTWTPAGTLVDGQMYSSPTTAADYEVKPGPQTG